MNQSTDWNNENDLRDIRAAFDAWAHAVIAKDRNAIEPFHDDGFLVTLPDGTLLDKDGHIALEIAAGMKVMDTLNLKTRRCGDLILVWARRFLRGTISPTVAGTTLHEGWVEASTMDKGFEQADFSVWRRASDSTLKCLAFELTMLG
ncbi:nuclear transport factor 2 family protein [Paraburkholderia sp. C35]|uniref:nuclear transport factor 2 family protein n=1 Tax=Paraburkholderia sp. C35 TaxID=2126993 RepID=UPI0013A534A9|nr:nuclear transport factor 2 family protein [Paraburkholderia sp. C35]